MAWPLNRHPRPQVTLTALLPSSLPWGPACLCAGLSCACMTCGRCGCWRPGTAPASFPYMRWAGRPVAAVQAGQHAHMAVCMLVPHGFVHLRASPLWALLMAVDPCITRGFQIGKDARGMDEPWPPRHLRARSPRLRCPRLPWAANHHASGRCSRGQGRLSLLAAPGQNSWGVEVHVRLDAAGVAGMDARWRHTLVGHVSLCVQAQPECSYTWMRCCHA